MKYLVLTIALLFLIAGPAAEAHKGKKTCVKAFGVKKCSRKHAHNVGDVVDIVGDTAQQGQYGYQVSNESKGCGIGIVMHNDNIIALKTQLKAGCGKKSGRVGHTGDKSESY